MKDSSLQKPTRREFLNDTTKLCLAAGLPSISLSCGGKEASGQETTPAAEKAGKPKSGFEPAYLRLHRTGELKKRAEKLRAIMEKCRLCPRQCGVNRLEGKKGFCRAPGATLVVSSAHPHFGEERPLVGRGGSGTIFLTHCNLRCVFCQNWEISHALFRGHPHGS
jgi:putative pyruvate formate lyase activating enzyme